MKNAILEIGTENLPARFISPALAQMEALAKQMLSAERLKFSQAITLGTPRRLTLILKGVAEKSDSEERLRTGPSAKLFKDEQGRYTPQALGFAKSAGVRPEELRVVSTPKGEMLQARLLVQGEPAARVLARVLPELIAKIQFPKSLEWEQTRFRFGRPIRNILALYGRKVVAFSLAGIRSGNKAQGLGVGAKPIPIAEAERYASKLKDLCIIADIDARRQALSKALEQAARRAGAQLDKDEALLEEIVFLTEHPVPVAGRFDPEYLCLPKALLSSVLKKQLKFFPLLKEDSSLEPGFVGVRDGVSEGQTQVQEGYERVLTARFSDAQFFFQRDLETRLEAKLRRLGSVTFQQGLGSMLEKAERVEALAEWLFREISPRVDLKQLSLEDLGRVQRIARLAYADLASEVVKEFPELQGTMGGVYARRDGEDERVAMGLEEFHFPLSAKAPLPARLDAALASLAGKLDTLAGLFLIGQKPTGSEDPFALRRAAAGAVRIVLERQLPLDLEAAAGRALELFAPRSAELAAALPRARRELAEFLWQRASAVFEEGGYGADEIRAIQGGALENLPRAALRLAAVHALRPHPDFAAIASAFKRARNILKQATPDDAQAGRLRPELLSAEAERSLWEAIRSIKGEVQDKVRGENFQEGLKELVQLKSPVDRFFNEVLVMDKDAAVKNNRLALLASLLDLFKEIADISHLQSGVAAN